MQIGFSFNKSKGGPATFMNNLKESWERQQLVKTSIYLNPFNSCNIFANMPKLTWFKRFFFRIDGIIFDLLADPTKKNVSNNHILKGARLAKGVVFQSEFSKNLFERILGYNPRNSTVICNGTDLSKFKDVDGSEIRQNLSIEKEAFVFITSAKWRAHKRLESMIESFSAFKKRHPKQKTYFLVIGEHEDLHIDNVIFLQRVENNKLPRYLAAADVYLFYSWLDNCPNSVIEAICCGLPVICTNQGGTPELIKMSNGGIIAEADEPFSYKEVELYNPPKPNMAIIATTMDEMYTNYSSYKQNINRKVFDIDVVAKKYFEFIKTNL